MFREIDCIYNRSFKIIFDLILSAVALILFFPLLLISALLIKISSTGPIFFMQERLGLNGRVFKIYKFRTMTDKPRKSDAEIIGKDSEVTPIGFWLRRLKIDELPQIINIIIGEMSIVGPRPALPDQFYDIKKNAQLRLSAKPGLTGLAQVNGNIHLSWNERWKYDIEYVKDISLIKDLKIIFKTILVILFGEEIFIKNNQ